jgi:hypothetical protein
LSINRGTKSEKSPFCPNIMSHPSDKLLTFFPTEPSLSFNGCNSRRNWSSWLFCRGRKTPIHCHFLL